MEIAKINHSYLTPALMSTLAREIGMGLLDIKTILDTFKISLEDYENLKKNEHFQKVVDSYRFEWYSAVNTTTRTQLEAAATLEQIIPTLFVRANDPKESLGNVVDVGKLLADIAGAKKQHGTGDKQEKFTIEINLGADTKLTFDNTKTIETTPMIEFDQEERV